MDQLRLKHRLLKISVKLRTTFAAEVDHSGLSNAGVVGSNPTQGRNVCVHLFCVCVVLCVGNGLATGRSRVQGVLLCIELRNKGLWSH
jgi:hypothetical protein